MPKLTRVVTTSKPSEQMVVRRCIAALVSLMALRSLVDLDEGKANLWAAIDSQLSADAFWDGVDPAKYLIDKVALKRREYCMPASMVDDDDAFGDTLDDIAAEYRRASRGG